MSSKKEVKKSIKSNVEKKNEQTKKNNKNKSIKKPVKKEKKTLKDILNSTQFLQCLFIALLVLVIVLSVFAYNKNKQETSSNSNLKANIVLPILDVNDELGFSINAIELSEAEEYVFKLTNYKDNKIIDRNIPYKIIVENGTDSVIELKEAGKDEDLMQNKVSLELDNLVMPAKEKKDVYYKVKMLKAGNLKQLDTINIQVNTKE